MDRIEKGVCFIAAIVTLLVLASFFVSAASSDSQQAADQIQKNIYKDLYNHPSTTNSWVEFFRPVNNFFNTPINLPSYVSAIGGLSSSDSLHLVIVMILLFLISFFLCQVILLIIYKISPSDFLMKRGVRFVISLVVAFILLFIRFLRFDALFLSGSKNIFDLGQASGFGNITSLVFLLIVLYAVGYTDYKLTGKMRKVRKIDEEKIRDMKTGFELNRAMGEGFRARQQLR